MSDAKISLRFKCMSVTKRSEWSVDGVATHIVELEPVISVENPQVQPVEGSFCLTTYDPVPLEPGKTYQISISPVREEES